MEKPLMSELAKILVREQGHKGIDHICFASEALADIFDITDFNLFMMHIDKELDKLGRN